MRFMYHKQTYQYEKAMLSIVPYVRYIYGIQVGVL
jgi:hypothetical protein